MISINSIKNIRAIFFIVMPLLLAMISIISIAFGPVEISLKEMFEIIFYNLGLLDSNIAASFTQIQEVVFLNIRLPRILLAIFVGVALGTSGAILQGLFRNPLVDPGFIGVSSGAAVGAMIAIMFSQVISYYFLDFLIPFILPLFAMTGAFSTTFLVYKMSKIYNKTNIMAMLLSGIAINALAGSIIGLFISISSDAQLRSFTFWTLGGLDSADWSIIYLSFFFIFIPFIMVYRMKNQMDVFMLGDAESQHLGLNIELLKKKIILISSIMVGISVSFTGMIGFIGLVTPHLVRLCIGPNHKYLIPGSALLGAILLTLSDFICKTVISPAQLPVGVITSAIGAPFFVWLIINQKRRFSYSE